MGKVIEDLKSRIIPVLRQHDVVRAAVFGSFARGEEQEDSDLDILVQLKEGKSLLDLVALKLELEEVLERNIDVVTYDALHPRIRRIILEQQVAII